MSVYQFDAKLLNSPTVTEELSGGRLAGKSVDLELSNADGVFTTDRDSGALAIGNYVRLDHYLPGDTPAIRTYLYGKITAIDIPGPVCTLTVTVEDPDIFSEQWPSKVYTSDDWSSAAVAPDNVNGTTKINPTADLGRIYPVGFGHCRKVRAVYVFADYTLDQYYYIFNRGAVEATDSDKGTKINVYRDGRLVDTDEYTVWDGTQAWPFGGYAGITFGREQYSGSAYYEITVDFYGSLLGEATAPRNPATILNWILSDSTIGIGQSTNTASFIDSATTLSTLGGGSKTIYIDGGIDEQTTLQDLIDHLAEECGRSFIYKNDADEWEITTDTYQSASQATFGNGDNNYRNIISLDSYSSIDQVKTVTVKYGKNNWTGEYQYSLSRNVNSDGDELVYEFPLIQDHESADLICCYMQRRLLYGNYCVDLELGMEARDLELFRPITVVQKWLSPIDRSEITNINGDFQIREIERGLYNWKVTAYTNSSDIYTYSAGSLPTDPYDDTITDYSFTKPSAPTSLAISTSGTRQGADGTAYSYYVLSCTAPSVNCQYIEFGFKQKNATNYQWVTGTESSGTWYGALEGIIPGQYYFFAARAINNNNTADCVQGVLAEIKNTADAGYLAPGDTTAPSTPTGLSATAGTGKSIVLDWDDSSSSDLSHYNIYRSTTNSFDEGNKIAQAKVSRFTDTAPAYATQYFYWVKALDLSGNPSSATSSVNATTSKITNDEITSMTADKITTGSITGQTITISTSASLNIDASAGIKVLSGGDIELQGTTSLTNYIRWKMTSGGSTYYLYEGAYYNTGISHLVYRVYPDVAKSQYYCIGNGYSYSFYGIEFDCSRFVLNTWGATSSYYKQVNFTYTDNALYPAANSGGTNPALGLTTNPWSNLVIGDTSNYWEIKMEGGHLKFYHNGNHRFTMENNGVMWVDLDAVSAGHTGKYVAEF